MMAAAICTAVADDAEPPPPLPPVTGATVAGAAAPGAKFMDADTLHDGQAFVAITDVDVSCRVPAACCESNAATAAFASACVPAFTENTYCAFADVLCRLDCDAIVPETCDGDTARVWAMSMFSEVVHIACVSELAEITENGTFNFSVRVGGDVRLPTWHWVSHVAQNADVF